VVVEGPEPEEKEQLVLVTDSSTQEQLVIVEPTLAQKLKQHQVEGLRFLFESCITNSFDSNSGIPTGCILAHCMVCIQRK
jgi:transcriptional regulator ATRX